MVSGINYAYNPYQSNNMLEQTYYNPVQYQQPILTGNVTATENNNVAAKRDNTADGKDDGSIGFWGATKNMAKGVWNFLTSPFKNEKGEWSLKSTLKSVAIGVGLVALNMIPGVGQVLTPALLAVGAAAGVFGAGKAAYNIATAETDAQAEAAWQSMGSSAATIAATAVGARGYAKAQAGAAAEAEALASGATEAEAAAAAEQASANSYNGIKGIKNAVGKTIVDTKNNVVSGATKGWNYTSAQFGKVTQAYKDGTLKDKLVAKYDSTVHDAKLYGRYARMKAHQVKNDLKEVYSSWKNMTPDQKKQVWVALKEAVADAAKENFGANRAEVLANAKAAATNPRNIGIHSWLTTQTVKPNFYDSLSKEEQAYFDSLPKAQREQLEDYYYSMV